MLSKGIASAGEINEISGVPRSRTYDVLESLEKQGFAMAKIGKPTKYIVVKPTLVLEKLKKKTLQHAEEKVKVLDKLKGTKEYEELESLHNTSFSPIKREDISGALKGKSDIYSHLRELVDNSEKEVLVSMPASELLDKARIFKGLFEKFAEKKLAVKVAVNGSDEDVKKIAEKYSIKPIKTKVSSKFFIIDRKQVLFSLTNSGKEDEEIAVWLNSDFFSSSLASMFEASLKNGR